MDDESLQWPPVKHCLLLLLVLLGCTGQNGQTTYFVPLPFTKFSAIQAPCLDVQIEDQTVCLELDLGFQGDVTIDAEYLEKIPTKTWFRSATIHGIQGKRYQTDLYHIPALTIGTTQFIEPTLQSNSHAFTQDSVFGTPSIQEIGRLGWQLFQNVNFLLDVAGHAIILCDSLKTLQKHGYATEPFIQTELFTDRGLLEFDAVTSSGPMRCTLDTGCTVNLCHTETSQSIEEMVRLSEPISSPFVIGSQEFGPIRFRQIPIQMPIPIRAILGMEFFQKHLVFIDFSKKRVCFSKLLKKTS